MSTIKSNAYHELQSKTRDHIGGCGCQDCHTLAAWSIVLEVYHLERDRNAIEERIQQLQGLRRSGQTLV